MATADRAAAQRAADELVKAGVGRVLLFGSVARGDAAATSDVDLIAIYDDLDYAKRRSLRGKLEAHATSAAGCPVDVMVTDAPEWRRRTTQVNSSVEARVAGYAVELADAPAHGNIDWEKEIGLPDTDLGELQARLTDVVTATDRLIRNLRPGPDELAAADEQDIDDLRFQESGRFAAAMGDVLAIVESAAKVTHVATLGLAAERTHKITDLLDPQTTDVVDLFVNLAGSDIDLGALHLWRQGSTYVADQPDRPSEQMLRVNAAAALRIASAAVDRCRHLDVPPEHFERWNQRVDRCRTALDAPIRLHVGGAGQ